LVKIKPALYIHKIVTKTQSFTGIIAGTSVADYCNDIIKKTRRYYRIPSAITQRLMKYSSFNTEPVLMTYPDNKTIENWILTVPKISRF
jgi:uncharacterized protein (DUF1015 family)